MVIGFLICAVVIFIAGRKLSYYSGIIARQSGLGNLWVGVVMLATVTSLPELIVGISSSLIVRSADLAVGNILGSCAFNLGLLALMDAFVPLRKPIFGTASQRHVMALAMGTILIAMAGLGIHLPDHIVVMKWIGIISFIFFGVYIFSMLIIYRFERRLSVEVIANAEARDPISLRRAIAYFCAAAVVIVAAALLLPTFAERIAQASGLGETFVGTLFLAASTTLPEMAVSLTAIRLGLIDISVGNLLGSNLFNVFILAIDDIFYTRGPLLKDASETNLYSVLAIVMMNGVAIIGLTYRQDKKRFLLAADSFIIFLIYVINLVLLYKMS